MTDNVTSGIERPGLRGEPKLPDEISTGQRVRRLEDEFLTLKAYARAAIVGISIIGIVLGINWHTLRGELDEKINIRAEHYIAQQLGDDVRERILAANLEADRFLQRLKAGDISGFYFVGKVKHGQIVESPTGEQEKWTPVVVPQAAGLPEPNSADINNAVMWWRVGAESRLDGKFEIVAQQLYTIGRREMNHHHVRREEVPALLFFVRTQ